MLLKRGSGRPKELYEIEEGVLPRLFCESCLFYYVSPQEGLIVMEDMGSLRRGDVVFINSMMREAILEAIESEFVHSDDSDSSESRVENMEVDLSCDEELDSDSDVAFDDADIDAPPAA